MRLTSRDYVSLAVLAALWVAAALAWTRVADRLPIHWTLSGEPDGVAGRVPALLLGPLLASLSFLLVRVRHAPSEDSPVDTVAMVIVLAVGGVYASIVSGYLGRPFDSSYPLGALFVWIGWQMRGASPNALFGIRTRWTEESPLSWRRSNQAGGILIMLLGALHVVLAMTGTARAGLLTLAALGAAVLALTVYSYIVWRRDPGRAPR